MTEDNNPSHENKGERSKDDTDNIKERERTNARKITTGESFLVVVAPFCFSSLSFSLADDDEEKQFSVQIQSIANGRDALTFFVFFFRKVKNCVGVCKRCVFYAHVRRACSSVLLLLEVELSLIHI